MGNAYYRMGEASTGTLERTFLWMQALDAYSHARSIHPDDAWAQDNYEYVLSKLQSEEKNAQNQNQQNNQSSSGS